VDRLKPLGDGSETVGPIQRIPLDGMEGRAIACGAIYTTMNNGKHDVLGAYGLSCETVSQNRKSLSDSWSIYGRFELLTTLEWLINKGHREGFDETVNHLKTLDGARQRVYINRQSKRDQQRCTIILNLTAAQKAESIPAWDLARLSNLARLGYESHYLTSSEALRLAIPVAAELRNKFDSWQAYGQNFILGRWYWRGSEEDKKEAESIIHKLMHNQDSPWKKYPWDMAPQQTGSATGAQQ
jgi:hypothetical protein